MQRLKTVAQSAVLPLLSLWPLTAPAAVDFSSYALVGFSVSQVAGASSLVAVGLAVLLAAAACVALLSLSLSAGESSVYTVARRRLGPTLTFLVGWAVVGESTLGASLIGKSVTGYVSFLANGTLLDGLKKCCTASESSMWSFFDPFSLLLVVCVGVMCAFSSAIISRMNRLLMCVNLVTVLATLLSIFQAGTVSNWTRGGGAEYFFSYGIHGTFKSAAIYSHVFLTLAAASAYAATDRKPVHSSLLGVAVTAIVAVITVMRMFLTTRLVSYDHMNPLTPVATHMLGIPASGWVSVLNAIGGICTGIAGIATLISLAAMILTKMASDNLVWSIRIFRRKSTSALSAVIVATVMTIVWSVSQDYRTNVLSISCGTIMLFQALLIVLSAVSSRLNERHSFQTVLNSVWALYFFTSPLVVFLTNFFGNGSSQQPVIQSVMTMTAILVIQAIATFSHTNCKLIIVQVVTSCFIGFSSFLMYHLEMRAWACFYMWCILGIVVHWTFNNFQAKTSELLQANSTTVTTSPTVVLQGTHNGGFVDDINVHAAWDDVRSHYSFTSALSERRKSFVSILPTRQSSFRSALDNMSALNAHALGDLASFKSLNYAEEFQSCDAIPTLSRNIAAINKSKDQQTRPISSAYMDHSVSTGSFESTCELAHMDNGTAPSGTVQVTLHTDEQHQQLSSRNHQHVGRVAGPFVAKGEQHSNAILDEGSSSAISGSCSYSAAGSVTSSYADSSMSDSFSTLNPRQHLTVPDSESREQRRSEPPLSRWLRDVQSGGHSHQGANTAALECPEQQSVESAGCSVSVSSHSRSTVESTEHCAAGSGVIPATYSQSSSYSLNLYDHDSGISVEAV